MRMRVHGTEVKCIEYWGDELTYDIIAIDGPHNVEVILRSLLNANLVDVCVFLLLLRACESTRITCNNMCHLADVTMSVLALSARIYIYKSSEVSVHTLHLGDNAQLPCHPQQHGVIRASLRSQV